jgi:hypothetical protein
LFVETLKDDRLALRGMYLLADIACFLKWAKARSCSAKTDAWRVFVLRNLAVAIERTSSLSCRVCIHWRTSPVSGSGQRQGHAPQRQMRGKSLLCTTLPLPSKQRPPLPIELQVL